MRNNIPTLRARKFRRQGDTFMDGPYYRRSMPTSEQSHLLHALMRHICREMVTACTVECHTIDKPVMQYAADMSVLVVVEVVPSVAPQPQHSHPCTLLRLMIPPLHYCPYHRHSNSWFFASSYASQEVSTPLCSSLPQAFFDCPSHSSPSS